MKARQTAKALLIALAVLPTGCVGISSGIDYPDVSDVDLDKYVWNPEGTEVGSVGLSNFKLNPKTCENIDTRFVTEKLDQNDLVRFFDTMKVKVGPPEKARSDLYWFDFPTTGDPHDGTVKLRLAILRDNNAAAKDLHDSLLEHGPGWWGVRRGNLALLAPKASLKEALRFAIKTHLVCWGMFTYTGVDDVYTTVGGYTEF